MALPLAIAAPATLAGAAWLNAKTHLADDLNRLSKLVRSTVDVAIREKRNRVNIFYVLEKHATTKCTANRTFLVYEGKDWTYAEVYELVLKYGTWLKKNYDIAPKEVVAVDFINSPHFIFIWFALWSLGALPAFLNYNLTGQPLLHCIRISTARIVFVDEEVSAQFTPVMLDAVASPKFRDGKGPVQVVIFDEAVEQQILAVDGKREPDASREGVRAYDMSSLIYTSGTTGLPKAAIITWNKALAGPTFVSIWLGMKPSDRFYTCMPLYHTAASLLGLCTCLIKGSTFILGRKFSTRKFWPEVRASKATIIQYVGETCRYLLAAPTELDPITGEDLDRKNSVRVAFGNGLRPDIWNRFKERFGIDTVGEFYASTEGPVASFNLSSNELTSGAVARGGMLFTWLQRNQVAIVEIDWETEAPLRSPHNNNFCKRVRAGTAGELLYRIGPGSIAKNHQCYFNNAQASDGKILRDVFGKGDTWFRTGDAMRIDSEGRWYFCDRIGDTFRWKSENVSTTEVSEALGMHEVVDEANVYGVQLPHHDGRAGCAAVVLHGKVTKKLLHELAAHAGDCLPKYAVPLFLRVKSEMHATGTNKQQKHFLRAEGVDPIKAREAGDGLFWLKGGTYVEFEDEDWEELKLGRIQL